jgi:predicted SnoaL-like aldol condensation-catalyzing enzyme
MKENQHTIKSITIEHLIRQFASSPIHSSLRSLSSKPTPAMVQSLIAIFSLSVVAATTHCADASALPTSPYCPSFPVTPEQQRAIFDRFTDLFLGAGKFYTAFTQHVAETCIQHNPYILSGRQNALDLFGNQDTPDPVAAGFPVNIITQSLDTKTQIGMFHDYFTPAPGKQPSVTVDIIRMNGSCIRSTGT